jgi:ubiquinone/menaquinone biosynthesis C-methylase UbiE
MFSHLASVTMKSPLGWSFFSAILAAETLSAVMETTLSGCDEDVEALVRDCVAEWFGVKTIRSLDDIPDGPFFIFGTALGAELLRDEIERSGRHSPSGFIDIVRTEDFGGLPVYAPERFMAQFPAHTTVVLSHRYVMESSRPLMERGFTSVYNAGPLVRHLAIFRPSTEWAGSKGAASSEEYWTRFNVTLHHRFTSAQDSLDYLEWRNLQYINYDELMPTDTADGKVVLDYGCGPGHDLVGYATRSRPSRLIAMDVSETSLEEARHRLALHCAAKSIEWVRIAEADTVLPLPDASIDIVHSSGVLHHTPDPERILREFRRILRPEGEARIMVYNRDSIFFHLHVAYQNMALDPERREMPIEEVFRALTDGPYCPISRCYRPDEFVALARGCGFEAHFMGSAVSCQEMQSFALRFEALRDRRLRSESRRFLYELTRDERGCPRYRGAVAGIDGCYRLTPR